MLVCIIIWMRRGIVRAWEECVSGTTLRLIMTFFYPPCRHTFSWFSPSPPLMPYWEPSTPSSITNDDKDAIDTEVKEGTSWEVTVMVKVRVVSG